MQTTLEVGIYHYGSRRTEDSEKYYNRQASKSVQETFEKSNYFRQQSRRETKCLWLSWFVLIVGCFVAKLFLLQEHSRFKRQIRIFRQGVR